MTQEDKDLLLRDLCARLPYRVKVNYNEEVCTIDSIGNDSELLLKNNDGEIIPKWEDSLFISIEKCKPYLFPLSSMTEEQKIECFKGTPLEIDKYGDISVKDNSYGGSQYTDLEIYLEVINWLLKNHFDFRGLIPKGLAVDCTNLNIY